MLTNGREKSTWRRDSRSNACETGARAEVQFRSAHVQNMHPTGNAQFTSQEVVTTIPNNPTQHLLPILKQDALRVWKGFAGLPVLMV